MAESLNLEQRFVLALQDIGRKPPPPPEEEDELEQFETVEGDEDEDKTARVRPPTPATINLFQHPDAHPITLDLMLLRQYGPEWLLWEPETLELRILQDFRTSSVSDLNMNKIQAVKSMHFNDLFWRQWEVFLWCAMPLNDVYPDFGIMQVPTVAQCLVAVDIANRVRQDVKWSLEVKTYLSVVFRHDGIFCTVPPIDFISIDIPELVDCEKVREAWPEVRSTGKPPPGETIENEQLRRMLLVTKYLEDSRYRLNHQSQLILND